MKSSHILIIAFILSSATSLIAQPELEWSKTYGGEATEVAYAVVQTPDSGFAMTGEVRVDNNDAAYLVRTDKDGDEIWSEIYEGESDYWFNDLDNTFDGGFILGGAAWVNDALEFLVMKVDADGAEEWSTTIGYAEYGDNSVNSIIQTADSGYAMVGYSSDEDWDYDFLAVKLNSDGEEVWSQRYGGDDNDEAMIIIQTFDGGYALSGRSASFYDGDYNFYLVKTDADGDEEWYKTYDGDGGREFWGHVIQTADSGFALAGNSNSFSESQDVMLVRADQEGEEIWTRSYGGDGTDQCYSLVETDDGGFALGCRTNSYGAGNIDFWLVRTDDEGETLWSSTFGGEAYDQGWDVISTFDKGYAFTGSTQSYGNGGSDFWLLKLAPDSLMVPFWHTPPPDVVMDEDEIRLIPLTDLYAYIFSPYQQLDSNLYVSATAGEFADIRVIPDTLQIALEQDKNGSAELIYLLGANDPQISYATLTVNPVNDPPETPVLITPADGSTVYREEYTAEFTWGKAIDIDGDTLSYNFHFNVTYGEIDTVLTFDSISDTTTTVDFGEKLIDLEIWDEYQQIADVYWWVVATDGELETESSTRRYLWVQVPLSVDNSNNSLPTKFAITSLYPNPFNSTTVLRYAVDKNQPVSVAMFDLSGREIYIRNLGNKAPGYYTHTITANDLPSGLYIVRLMHGEDVKHTKVALVR